MFLENMGTRNFIPLRMNSIDASNYFDNNSCDVIYIDMDHEYESVYSDILCWLPKIKSGGTLAGHDYYNMPGVKKAVNELLSPITVENNSWIYQVN